MAEQKIGAIRLSENKIDDPSIKMLGTILQFLISTEKPERRLLHALVTRIYRVTEDTACVVIPPSFEQKVCNWLGGHPSLLEAVKKQSLVYIYNNILGHGTVYNPLRQKRPKPSSGTDILKQIDELSETQTQGGCDFCDHKNHTAAESHFGRLENSSAFSFAKTFKLTGWHSLIGFGEHHPLNWSYQHLHAAFQLASEWFQKVHDVAPEYQYPMIIWDLLPGAGASQIHPHIQVLINKHRYCGVMEHWDHQMTAYRQTHNTEYFSDILKLSEGLGLVTSVKSAHAMPSLTPQESFEVLFVSETAGTDLYRLIYYTIKVYFERFNVHGFSLGMALPPMGVEPSDRPVYARIVSRPALRMGKSDISSFNLYMAAEVDSDPFGMAKVMQSYVQQQETEPTVQTH